AVLLEADLDERGLHAGQDVVDRAEIDVARDRALVGPLEVDLGDAVVLQDRDALLADVDGDEELTLRGRERRALRRLAAARRGAGAGGGARRRFALGLALGRLLLGGRLLRGGLVRLGGLLGAGGGLAVRGGGRRAGLLAALASAGAAAAFALLSLGLRAVHLGGGRDRLGLDDYGACGCDGLGGRLRVVGLATEPRKWQRTSPSETRATAAPAALASASTARRVRVWLMVENLGMSLCPQASSAARRTGRPF